MNTEKARNEDASAQPTQEQLKEMLRPIWHYNQHGAKLNVNGALGAVGTVKPEVKHQPQGDWMGQVVFDSRQYQSESDTKQYRKITIEEHGLENRPTAQDWVEGSIVQAALPATQEVSEPIPMHKHRAG